jgi:glycosyltransferase involved in cell wall biosynthesis
MKIAAILDMPVTVGGGFNQALNAIMQMNRLTHGIFDFVVYTTVSDNISYLSRLGISAKHFQVKQKSIASRIYSRVARQIGKSQKENIDLLESRMLEENVDLVYFVTPLSEYCNLKQLNYIATVWDLCHRDMPEFPEVHSFGEFQDREQFYSKFLTPAVLILADSETLAERISSRYGVDRFRTLAMPFAAAPFIEETHANSKTAVLEKYCLNDGYYFYPGQFWAHKNHVRILEALRILKNLGNQKQVVFVGKDHGNRGHIEIIIDSLGLAEQVKILGFVPVEDMRGLYEGCAAVVMPTYFGPTNLPPLEAWVVGRPLVYSNHLAEQAGDAALLADPDDEHSLAMAMQEVIQPQTAERLVQNGKVRLRHIDGMRAVTESKLIELLHQFEKRRSCWGQTADEIAD